MREKLQTYIASDTNSGQTQTKAANSGSRNTGTTLGDFVITGGIKNMLD